MNSMWFDMEKHVGGSDTVGSASVVLKDAAPPVREEAQTLHWSNKNGKLATLHPHPWRALGSNCKNTCESRAPENVKTSRYSAGKWPYWGNVFPCLVPEARKG